MDEIERFGLVEAVVHSLPGTYAFPIFANFNPQNPHELVLKNPSGLSYSFTLPTHFPELIEGGMLFATFDPSPRSSASNLLLFDRGLRRFVSVNDYLQTHQPQPVQVGLTIKCRQFLNQLRWNWNKRNRDSG